MMVFSHHIRLRILKSLNILMVLMSLFINMVLVAQIVNFHLILSLQVALGMLFVPCNLLKLPVIIKNFIIFLSNFPG